MFLANTELTRLHFSYKQQVYKQQVLSSYSHKQLSVLNIASISNHLKIEIKKEIKKNRNKQFH